VFDRNDLDRQELARRVKALSQTVATSRRLRERAHDLINRNLDLREFLRENLLIAMARLEAWTDTHPSNGSTHF